MRQADYAIDSLFLRRHSPRAMSGAPVAAAELNRLFEAARWAPSSSNSQPWRFVVAKNDQPAFVELLAVLAEFNRAWCARAAALVVVCTQTVRTAADGTTSPARLAAFDAGAAWMSLALQGRQMGLVVHAMEGFDHAKAAQLVRAPAGIDVLAVVAVGVPGDAALLHDKQRAGEARNGREPIATRVFDSHF